MKDIFLYMDTSDHLVAGLFDSHGQWICYYEEEGRKNSGKIHSIIHDFFEKNSLNPLSLSGIVQNAGPGSYTGMRVSEGLAQIFEWQKVPIFSFHHFEVPRLLGIKEGKWFAKAFKGEFFCFSFGEDGEKTALLNHELAQKEMKRDTSFTHYVSSLSNDFPSEISLLKETGKMIYEDCSKLFPLILKRQARYKPYYFRSLEQEFKVST